MRKEKFAFGVVYNDKDKKFDCLAKRGWRVIAETAPHSTWLTTYEKIRTDLDEI